MHIKMGAEARPFFSPRLQKNEAARGRGTRTQGIHLPVLFWLLLLLGDFRKKKRCNNYKKEEEGEKVGGVGNLTESR